MNNYFNWKESLKGGTIYAVGDTIAALILGEFMLSRLLGMFLVGGLIYALEIPAWFKWIDKKWPVLRPAQFKRGLIRASLAQLMFNPLWIFRHLVLIQVFSGIWPLDWKNLLLISWYSFLGNLVVSMVANYLLLNKTAPSWRFPLSAVFSGSLAIYYALSQVIFG